MCFFKKSTPINSKYKVGDFVNFKFRNELTFGFIWKIYLGASNEGIYDIQVGGQCPAVIEGISEEKVTGYHR